ncbi:hypothetical protein NOR_07084 [Metarhizium rileyi]|uniref:Uncharacterized protein n=1 Tax=Metarhizium rileyi (strain RCEF 4871) TaxID=1649241 RepID=A0A166YZE7_METRR|nr:hypothetical protein NOR_07084 [Metarhizium rileyi RCEF 4871]
MATITSTNLTNIVLLFADFTGVNNILTLSNNAAFEFTPPSKDADPKAPGNDAADVSLAKDNTTGVSKRHLNRYTSAIIQTAGDGLIEESTFRRGRRGRPPSTA